MNPKVSVLMSVYNGEKYLYEAIESVLNQSYENFEFIITDDGSTDHSVGIVKKFDDPRIHLVVNKENIWISRSINNAIKISRGEYLARMDADDICMPQRFREQVKFMDENPDIGVCSANVIFINEHSKVASGPLWNETILPVEWEMLWTNPLVQPAAMIRKSVLKKNELWYSTDHRDEDYNLWSKIILFSGAARLDEVLLKYRITKDSAFINYKEICLSDSLRTNQELLKSITGVAPPDFHEDLTEFKKALNLGLEYKYELKDIKHWLNRVVNASLNKYNWDNVVLQKVRRDANWKMLEYIKYMPISKVKRLPLMLRYVEFTVILNYFFKELAKRKKLTNCFS